MNRVHRRGRPMPYRVIVDIKDKWWSDERLFQNFAGARTHQGAVARRWSDCGTAVLAPDGRVLNFQESENFKAQMREEQ